jgi:mono/diheme cytochrome c family protein
MMRAHAMPHPVRAIVIAALVVCTAAMPAGAQPARRGASPGPAARTYTVDTNEELQPATLPPLPVGMTVDMLVDGDRIFHGTGGCFACHGAEGQGLPAAGDAITSSLSYARHEWKSIDSLIIAGLPDALTRSPIAMPARGARGDLTESEVQHVAAYVWAISGVRGEPWPGGHASHGGMLPPGSTRGTAPAKPVRVRSQVPDPSPGQAHGTARSTSHTSGTSP